MLPGNRWPLPWNDPMHRRALLLGLLLAGLVVPAEAETFRFHSYLGQVPPELSSEAEHWLSGGERITLAQLRGKVVWLQYHF
jgi:hypothetical protein